MRTLLILALYAYIPLATSAQSGNSLKDYLATHRYSISVDADGKTKMDKTLSQKLEVLTKEKPMVVYGEGFSHNLLTNGYLEAMFIEFLAKHNLKYVFGEEARSWIVVDNFYYKQPNIDAASFYPHYKPSTQKMLEVFKRIYQGAQFDFLAVDFERPLGFKTAMDTIVNRLNASKRTELKKLAPSLVDTTYLALSSRKFIKFYEEERDKFLKDTNTFKNVLGTLYPSFHYLMSDPHPSQFADNRNKNMAEHIITQIGPPNEHATYFTSCGSAHSQRGKRDGLQRTTVNYLENSEMFHDKILVVNLYCEGCIAEPTKYGIGDNSKLGFMKGEILASFQEALGETGITLFDLSELPKEYRYIIEDYGDILVYAKGQK